MLAHNNLTPDLERLVRRAARLTFGVFATIGSGADIETRAGGSGIFLSPFTGLTARHVSLDLLRLEGRDSRPRTKSFLTQHSVGLFQVLDPFDEKSERALWHVDRSWNSRDTDLTLLQVSAEDATSDRLQYSWPTRFFDLHLLPPPRVSRIVAIGFPQLGATPSGDTQIALDAPFTVKEGQVTKIYQIRADLGMLNFPCFEVDIHFDHGFSGGPVFFNDQLCGLVSHSSSFDARSTCASLWPLALARMDNEFGTEWTVADMLNNGTLFAVDWREVKGRISLQEDEHGRHAFLQDAGESDVRGD